MIDPYIFEIDQRIQDQTDSYLSNTKLADYTDDGPFSPGSREARDLLAFEMPYGVEPDGLLGLKYDHWFGLARNHLIQVTKVNEIRRERREWDTKKQIIQDDEMKTSLALVDDELKLRDILDIWITANREGDRKELKAATDALNEIQEDARSKGIRITHILPVKQMPYVTRALDALKESEYQALVNIDLHKEDITLFNRLYGTHRKFINILSQ